MRRVNDKLKIKIKKIKKGKDEKIEGKLNMKRNRCVEDEVTDEWNSIVGEKKNTKEESARNFIHVKRRSKMRRDLPK